MKDTEIAYLAGFIDGDGTISVSSDNGIYYPRVSIYNNNLEVINWARALINLHGGMSTKPPKKENHEISYTYTWTYNSALYVAEACLPYLIVKKRNAELLMNWKNCTPRNGCYTEGIKQRKEALVTEMRQLNAKGKWSHNSELYLSLKDVTITVGAQAAGRRNKKKEITNE